MATGLEIRDHFDRAIRTQTFLKFTEEDLMSRDKKAKETYESLRPQRHVITKEQADNFFNRLLEDTIRR